MPSDAAHRIRTAAFPVVPLLLVLALPFGIVAADGGSEPDEASLPRDVERQTVEAGPGQVAYHVSGTDGATTLVVDGPLLEDVIVQLSGAPLGLQRRGLGAGRLSAARIQSMAAAGESLDAQHERFARSLAARSARGAQARGLQAAPARIRHHYKHAFNGVALRAPAWLVEELRGDPEVAGVWPDVTVKADLAQGVPLIRAPELHAQGITGQGVVVGIIDTGVDYSHPDLGGGFGPGFKVIGGYDFVNRDGDPRDDRGHGTHVAGIVAGSGTIKGVAPDAKLVAYKVLNASGSGTSANIIAAIDRSADPDGDPTTADALDVINLSLGGPGDPDDPMSRAIDGAAAAGVLPVVSAGNSGSSYQTIGSPGTARRALTVGATDKTDRLASFSSRGPTDKIYGIKPEVCAPGVSIVSTLPGGASGPASGTSMAAPHVAGAAALLLQARPSLTPDAVKSVLMTSARDLGLNLFAQGTGRIDVAAAAQRTTIVSPAALSLGIDDISLPFFAASATVNVTNLSDTARVYAASVLPGLPAGVTLTVAPPMLALGPGATATVGVSLHVDNSVVPNVTADPLAYVGRVRLLSESEEVKVPVAFFKGALLKFTFDRTPSLLVVRNAATGQIWSRRPTSPLFTLLVPPGGYDAYTSFLTAPGPGRLRSATVVRSGIVVSTVANLAIRSTEAVHVLTAAPVDENGQPAAMRTQRSMLRRPGVPFDFTVSFTGFPGLLEHAYSTLDAGHLADWLVTSEPAAQPEKAYSFYWHRAGIQGGETLTNLASELTTLTYRLDADTAAPSFEVSRWNVGIDGVSAIGTGTRFTLKAPYVWQRVVMPKPPGASYWGYVDHDVLGAGLQLLHTTPLVSAAAGSSSVSALGFAGGRFEATPLYDTTRTTFDVGLEPYAWWGRFVNTASSVRVAPAFGIRNWLFVGQMTDHRAAPTLPYTLRQGETVIRTGTFSGTGGSLPAVPVPPGRYTLDVQGPAGTLDGQPTSTTMSATFDTTAADRNPPTLSHFRIETASGPTKDLCLTERAEVRFRAKDDVALGQVRFFFRLAAGSHWVPWPLQLDGDEYVARLPLGAANVPNLCRGATKAIPIAVRLEAADAQGNSVQTEMTPAYARRVPQWNLAPLSVETP